MTDGRGVANSDYMPDEFMPGIAWAGNLPPGSNPVGPRDTDSVTTDVTPATGAFQDQFSATAGTVQPRQDDDGFGVVTHENIVSTGAGGGHTDAWARHPWQQSATGGAR